MDKSTLDPEGQKYIESQIAHGRFKDANEVMNTALRFMKEQDEWLQNEIDRGLRSPSGPWDVDEFLTKAHKKADKLGLD